MLCSSKMDSKNMHILKVLKNISPWRGMPVDDKGGSSKVVDITDDTTVQLYYWNSGVRTIDAGQIAGIVVEAKLLYDNIKNSSGSMEGTDLDTSLSFTSTALTAEVAIDYTALENSDNATGVGRAIALTSKLTNGQYVVDYTTGMIYGKKADTSVTLTSTAYKVVIELSGGGAILPSDINFTKINGSTVIVGLANLVTSPQGITDSFVDLGAEIDMQNYNQLGLWIDLDVGTSTSVELRILHKHTTSGADEYREINLDVGTPSSVLTTINLNDYRIGTDADQKFKINIPVSATSPFVQLQIKDSADGDGVITKVDITKAYAS